jgi:hypothetical protein
MDAFPYPDYDDYHSLLDSMEYDCFSIKFLCIVAVKVTVTRAGIVKWVPIVKDTIGYGHPMPYVDLTDMNCQEYNASGLFQSASCLAAHPGPQHNTAQALDTAG